MKTYPFHYEVRINIFKDKEEERKGKFSQSKIFKDQSPLISRRKAFDEFNEYLDWIRISERLHCDGRGNYTITPLPFALGELDKSEFTPNDIEKLKEYGYHTDIEGWDGLCQPLEYIAVYLVMDDMKIIHDMDNEWFELLYAQIPSFRESEFIRPNLPSEYLLHKVASYAFDEDAMLSNLDTEIEIYDRLKIDISNEKKIIEHFGEDFAESGEVDYQDGILPTPYIWKSKKEYYDTSY